jgi:hypothetical protein
MVLNRFEFAQVFILKVAQPFVLFAAFELNAVNLAQEAYHIQLLPFESS